MKIKKIICAVLCSAVLLMTLSGCGIWDRAGQLSAEMAVSDKDKFEVTEELLKCFSEDDAEGLKAMLCSKTQGLADIDVQIKEVLDFFRGGVISRDDDLSGSEGESVRNGITTELDRKWFIEDIQTDAAENYEITVHQYIVSTDYPEREGIVQLNISRSDGEEVIIGYEWTYYSAVGNYNAIQVLNSLVKGGLGSIHCDRFKQIPNLKEQLETGADFIEGVPHFGKSEGKDGTFKYDGRKDIQTRVKQEEYVENHEATRVYLEIYVDNIETDAGKKYRMEIYMYEVNTEDETLEGVMKIVLYDEDDNTYVIGENFHNT